MARTLIVELTRQLPSASKQTLKRMVLAGRVFINKRPAKMLSQPLAEGDLVAVLDKAGVRPKAPSTDRQPSSPARFAVVYEDADVLVANKPAGLLTSTVPGERRPTLLAMVIEYLASREPRARVGLIHRLDRDASGLLIFSKNPAAFRTLKQEFLRHEVERVYSAVVRGAPIPPAGQIESELVERADGTVRSTRVPGKGQRAVTKYEMVRTRNVPGRGRVALLKVTLQTGRKHQIRAHLAERGMPILGDPLYGLSNPAKTKLSAKSLMLAAVHLAVTHPRTGERLSFTIPLPRPMAELAGEAADKPQST